MASILIQPFDKSNKTFSSPYSADFHSTNSSDVNFIFNLSCLTANNFDNASECVEFPNTFDKGFTSHKTSVFSKALLIVCYSLVFFPCLIGNSLVLLVFTRDRKMRTRTNLLLGNLAVADLLTGIFCLLPTLYSELYYDWPFGNVLCKVHHFSATMTYTVSILLLAIIATERYIAINHPFKERRLFTKHKMLIVQISVWLLAGLYSLPNLFSYSAVQVDDTGFCVLVNLKQILDFMTIFTFVFWYIIPLTTMIVMYSLVVKTLWETSSPNQIMRLESRLNTVLTDDASPKVNGRSRSTVLSRSSTLKSSKKQNSRGSLSESRSLPNGHVSKYENGTISNGNTHKKLSPKGSNDSRTPLVSRTSLNKAPSKIFHSSSSPKQSKFPKTISRHQRYSNSSDSSESERFTSSNIEQTLEEMIPLQERESENKVTDTETVFTINTKSSSRNTKSGSKYCKYRVTSQRMSRRKVIRLLIIVLVTFAVLVLPNHVRHFIYKYSDSLVFYSGMQYVSTACYLLMHLNSAVNPVLYTLLSESFKRSLKNLFCSHRYCKPCLHR